MTARAECLAFFLAINLLLAVTAVGRARAEDESADAAVMLQTLAQRRFGTLNAAELAMVRGAAMRNLVWLGPSNDPNSPGNDVKQAERWGDGRTVRAEVIRWLASDEQAGRYIHPSGPGFAGARVAGRIDFSYLRIQRPITMLGCYIPDGIDLSEAHLQAIDLRRSRTGAINADSAEIDGDVSMLRGDYGPVSLFRARIGGNLDFIGARVTNPGEDAILAMESTVGGDADFHQGFTTDGIVDFRVARIGHSLSFHDARFVGGGDNGLNAERAVISGTVYWVDVTRTAHTILDLSNVHAEGLSDDPGSWPAPGNLNIDGFVYGSLVDAPEDAALRLKWLALEGPGYRPQPYQQLARVLAAAGDDGGATQVLIAQRAAQRSHGNLSRIERLWNLVLQLTIGYGFRPLRAVWWMIGFVGAGTLLFALGYRMRIVTPTDADAYASFVKDGIAPAHYPEFNALAFSLEHFWPFVDLHQGLYWRPNPRACGDIQGRDTMAGRIPARLLRWYLWVHIVAGWTITPLLLAGLSGLIRPD